MIFDEFLLYEAQILECIVPQTVGAAYFFPLFNLFSGGHIQEGLVKEAGAKGAIDSLQCHKKGHPFVMMAAAIRQTSSKVSVQLLKTVNNNKDQRRSHLYRLNDLIGFICHLHLYLYLFTDILTANS